jgi:3-dehydroquinate synthase
VSAPRRLRVELGARGYDIVIGSGVLAQAGKWLAPVVRQRRAIVVTDAHVAERHLAVFSAALAAAGIAVETLVLPPGEATKSLAQFAQLCEDILARGVERATPIVALGGGVIGDLAGFAAASLLRGLDFVQVPTTLLAQVDSSVGGKTAVDTRHGKNLVGAFHQPLLVLADVDTLATLPRRELVAGYAEVVKYGLIRDRGFYDWLEANAAALIAGEPRLREEAVWRSCAIKAAVVAADERESGERALLNFGHTFGHALEAAAGFGEALLHGEAVALGMQLAFELSLRLGLCKPETVARVRRHLALAGLPTSLGGLAGDSFSAPQLVAAMRRDKKVSGGRISLILARDIGDAFVCRDVLPATLENFLADALLRGKNSLAPASAAP